MKEYDNDGLKKLCKGCKNSLRGDENKKRQKYQDVAI